MITIKPRVSKKVINCDKKNGNLQVNKFRISQNHITSSRWSYHLRKNNFKKGIQVVRN